MAKCAYCKSRKGKRSCPVLDRICSQCCGTHRGREIACPTDCVHLPDPSAAVRAALAPALEKLIDFSQHEVAGRASAAAAALLGDEREVEEWEASLLFSWVAHGHEVPGSGRSLDRFLARRGGALEPDERRALEAMREARVSVFRVREVVPEVGLHLTDLRTGEEIFVHERMGTRDTEVGEHRLAWIVDIGGKLVFTGGIAAVAEGHVPAMVEEASREESPRGIALALHQALRRSLRLPLDARIGPKAEALVIARAEFEIDDREKVLRRLSSHADFVKATEDRFDLVPREEWTSAGMWVRVRRVGLSLTAFAPGDLAGGRTILEKALGPLVRHRFDRIENLSGLTGPQVEERICSLLGELACEELPPEAPGPGNSGPVSILPREELFREIEGLWPAVRDAAADLRSRLPAGGLPGPLEAEEVFVLPASQEFFECKASDLALEGRSREFGRVRLQHLAGHLFWLVAHEFNRRKTFRVDEDLAFALSKTTLDLSGADLRLPFPCAAFVFTDRSTLDFAESLLATDPTSRLSVHRLKVLCAVAMEGRPREEDGAVPLYATLLFSAGGAGEPYMLQRHLYIQPEDRLEAILESHFPDTCESDVADVFRVPETKKLLHLLLNAILYTTSADVETVRLPPRKRRARARGGQDDEDQGAPPDDVFYLPGRISISKVRHLRDLEASDSGRRIMVRFLVRGHWRRANPNWNDQRLRWIEPHWKGPDIATVVEREYRLRS